MGRDPLHRVVSVRLTVQQLQSCRLVRVSGLAAVCCQHALGLRHVFVVGGVGENGILLQRHPADSDDGRHFV